jgi:ABC-type phosphate/phosphonate transport system substrate-binding protein
VRRLLVVLLLVVAFTGCKRPQAGTGRPLVIVFGPQYAPKNAEALKAELSQRSKLQLELRVAATDSEAIDLVQSGTADVALSSLFDFLYCADVFHVTPLVQVLRGDGQAMHAGEWVVKADSTVQDLSGLAGQRVGYVDEFSVTGFLLPAARLREAKVTVQPAWLGGHDAVLAAVAKGEVAAGATYAGHWSTVPGLRVLGSTGTIANEPVFVQSSLAADTRDALRAALLGVHDAALLEGVADVTGFREIPPGTYDAAKATVSAAGRSVEDIVAGGWKRANEHRRPIWSYGP